MSNIMYAQSISVDFGQIFPNAFQTRMGFVMAWTRAQIVGFQAEPDITKADHMKLARVLGMDFRSEAQKCNGAQVRSGAVTIASGRKIPFADIPHSINAYSAVQVLKAAMEIERRLILRRGRQDAITRLPMADTDRSQWFNTAIVNNFPGILTMQAEAKFMVPHKAYMTDPVYKALVWPFVKLANDEAIKIARSHDRIIKARHGMFIGDVDYIPEIVSDTFSQMNKQMRENVVPCLEETLANAHRGQLGTAPRFGKH